MIDIEQLQRACKGEPLEEVVVTKRYLRQVGQELQAARSLLAVPRLDHEVSQL